MLIGTMPSVMGCSLSMEEGRSFADVALKDDKASAPDVKEAAPKKFLLLNWFPMLWYL
jgi:hypothetical protein